jgi:hypothetical protein
MNGDGSAGAGARGRRDRSKGGDVLESAASMMQFCERIGHQKMVAKWCFDIRLSWAPRLVSTGTRYSGKTSFGFCNQIAVFPLSKVGPE